jgi:CRP-like cAMP-binding protein
MVTPLLARLQQVGSVPAADHDLLVQAWQPRSVAVGESLLVAGAVCQEWYFVEQGVLRLVTEPLRGPALTHFFVPEHQFCTVLASFESQLPADKSIQAVTAARVLVLSKARLAVLEQQLPYFANLLARLIQQGLLAKLHLRQAYLGQDAAARYQTLLRHQPDVAYRVPQHMLASYLQITPQSLSRLRKTQR